MSTTQLENLITGAEVARRLGLSTERVRQLAGRPDFPPPAGRVGKAVVWKTSDVEDYAAGRRAFFAVNGISIGIDKARELAARLDRQAGAHRSSTAGRIAATIEGLLDTGGAIKVAAEDAEVVFGALQRWLEDTNVDVFGEQLMDLRYRLFADLQDAGRLPR
jgi:predicted DNA-binding transcriptional regulator AlpA